jgi:hypothetical protein
MRLPSRTVRIERSALRKVLALCGPRVEAGKCISCGGAEVKCSPPYMEHSPTCKAMAFYLAVRHVLDYGTIEQRRRK